MSEIMEQLNGEVSSCLNYMSTMSPDDDKYEMVANQLHTLCRAKAELEKIDLDREEHEARREIDIQHYQEQIDAEAAIQRAKLELEQDQIKSLNKNKWLDFGVAVGGILIPIGVEVVLFIAGMKFEETGTITSRFYQMMLNSKLFKHKKT